MNKAGKHTPPFRSITEAIARTLRESFIAALATLVVAPESVGAKILIEESGAHTGSLGDDELNEIIAQHAQLFLASRAEAATFDAKDLDFARVSKKWADARVLFERIEPEPRVVVCGAGHVGAQLAQLARLVNYRATLIDDRADFVRRERFPDENIELVVAENWRAATRRVIGTGRGVYVAIVTRGHTEDEECLRAVVEAQPDYVGLIGSKRRTNIVLQRLRAEGVDENRLKEIRAPIGLDIAAVSPEEVALAILAEMIAVRRGGRGSSLSAWRRK